MADHAILAKAQKELEDIYLGIPDESVNLTFGDLTEVKPVEMRISDPLEPGLSIPLEPIKKVNNDKSKKSTTVVELTKLPSLDFSRALEATAKDNHYNNRMAGHPFVENPIQTLPRHPQSPYHGSAYDGKSYGDMSGMTMGASVAMNSYQDCGKGRRPGIPHSNICTICSNYIYMCKHRCLVCGRAYCKQCVGIGMGDMTEGRKCLECLGKKFSQRYIQRAGQVSCCMNFKYTNEVMHRELKWAEKGPRKTGEKRFGQSRLVSPLRSPMTPRTPTRPNSNQGPHSFVMSSPLNHHLPF